MLPEGNRARPEAYECSQGLWSRPESNGDLEGADNSYRNALELNSRRHGARGLRGNVFLDKGDLNGAETSFR